jgi:hypothetical protein
MQLAIGLAMAVRMGIEGAKDGVLFAALWAIGGFVMVSPIAALMAWIYAVLPSSFFVFRIRWIRTALTGLFAAVLVVGCMVGADYLINSGM